MYSCNRRTHHEYIPEKVKAPIPWIGIYVALASLVCTIEMAADAFNGFRHKKLWIPCKFFAINAASLTMLAVAMKLPVDLTTDMPSKTDQLVKLSSTAFLSTSMGNFMPSLGTLNDNELPVTITALGILVITILVNVCIQLGTGLLSCLLMIEHVAVMFFMLVLLIILSFSALSIPTIKNFLHMKYGELHVITSTEESEEIGLVTVQKLKDYVKRYWMMVETGSPQFVVARSVTCSALGVLCSLTGLILLEAEFRMHIMDTGTYSSNYLNSDYKWSVNFILVIQTMGVVVGTIAPVFRWFIAAKSLSEHYWIERLEFWKGYWPQRCRKFVHDTKNLILNFCIGIQIVIVTASKLVLLISSFLISPLLSSFHYCKVFKLKFLPQSNGSSNHTGSGSESEPGTQLNLRRFVLNLDGEEELSLQIMKNNRNGIDHFIERGNKRNPKFLKELLQKSTDFMGVANFDSNQVPSLNSVDPPNCWSLPVVTLTSIAMALPNIANHKVKSLQRSVMEGLVYAARVEKILDAQADYFNIRNAADFVWLGVALFGKWLDEDLRKIALEGKTSKETLRRLANMAKHIVIASKENMEGNPKVFIAANSMYRISQTVLLDYEMSNDQTDERLFEQLSVMIADILGACFTNLPRSIVMKCYSSAIGKMEKSVQHAAEFLGETEEILEILQQHELPRLYPHQAGNINEWRALMNKKDPLASTSPSNNGASSSGSSNLHIPSE